jgi:hypothetical protein
VGGFFPRFFEREIAPIGRMFAQYLIVFGETTVFVSRPDVIPQSSAFFSAHLLYLPWSKSYGRVTRGVQLPGQKFLRFSLNATRLQSGFVV